LDLGLGACDLGLEILTWDLGLGIYTQLTLGTLA